MARRKKKSKLPARATPKSDPASPNITSGPPALAQTQRPSASPNLRKGLSPATCLAGMFLTLILGLYLGTLLPEVFQKAPASTFSRPSVPQPEAGTPGGHNVDPELQEMAASLEARLNANPDSAPDWINLGNVYFDSQQPEKAIPAYEHALVLAPQNADVWTDLGIMYRETGQFERALDCFKKAVEANPKHENALYNEGVVLLYDLQKKPEAATAWQKLLNINPQARSPQGKPLSEIIKELN